MKSTKELLGGRIRELRKGLKMSQEQLSELVDVDPRYISRIELGKCFPSLEKLESIAHALKAEMRELFDYEHHRDELEIQDVISKILDGVEDRKQQQMILRITKAVTRSVVNDL
ncbi:MAG: helix-turn-helix domain-containing protein [Desulfuromonadaceae bacterium]